MTAIEFKRKIALSIALTVALLFATAFVASPTIYAAAEAVVENPVDYNAAWICIAAAVAFGFGALAAGWAISTVGSAAMGAISEKPEIASNALIFIGLAEGLVVFGFITALMILGKV